MARWRTAAVLEVVFDVPFRLELVRPDECVDDVADEVADAFSGMPNPLLQLAGGRSFLKCAHERAIILVGLS
jgi:hypothetical protein